MHALHSTLPLLFSAIFRSYGVACSCCSRLHFPRPFFLCLLFRLFCAMCITLCTMLLCYERICCYTAGRALFVCSNSIYAHTEENTEENHKPNWLHAANELTNERNDHLSQNSLKSIVHKRISVSLRNTAVRLECSDENE